MISACLSPAFAQAPLSNEQTLDAERLGEEGVNAFLAGQFDKALKPLESGYELSGWGTIGVWLAKTHERLNQPLDAYRVHSEVAASPVVPGEAAPFAQAREEAKTALARLELSYAVLLFESQRPVQGLQVSVNGETRRLSKLNALAVPPGEMTVDIRWDGKQLPTKSFALRAGQHEVVDLNATSEPAAKPVPEGTSKGQTNAIAHTLDFSMVELTGWTLHDQQGNLVCTLPCKWSGTDADTLTVRHGEQKLPVRLGRRYVRDPNLSVSVNPERGSKGWALGLGIPAGIFFVGSLLSLSESDYPAITATSTGVFGAGFGVCVWWFIWSKSRPYLDYDVPEAKPAAKSASIGLDFYGNGLGLSGKF
jgi:hypothetical protein